MTADKIDRMQHYNYVDILGITFPVISYDMALQTFQGWISKREPHQVCPTNVHTLVTSLYDSELRAIGKQAYLTMDGMPIVWYANIIHSANIKERVCGPDLMLRCLEYGRRYNWRHYFLGGTEPSLADLIETMRLRYPGLTIAGSHSPPYRELSNEEDQALVESINAARPDFLWVALGAPKQEKWIAAHLDRIHVPVQIGVGAAFNYHSGHVSRAPDWMQAHGLEWCFRVFQEKRLIRRYLVTNQIFLLLFGKAIVQKILRRETLRGASK